MKCSTCWIDGVYTVFNQRCKIGTNLPKALCSFLELSCAFVHFPRREEDVRAITAQSLYIARMKMLH